MQLLKMYTDPVCGHKSQTLALREVINCAAQDLDHVQCCKEGRVDAKKEICLDLCKTDIRSVNVSSMFRHSGRICSWTTRTFHAWETWTSTKSAIRKT